MQNPALLLGETLFDACFKKAEKKLATRSRVQ
jgi:hypothetical protein